jgi:hypothetical protein
MDSFRVADYRVLGKYKRVYHSQSGQTPHKWIDVQLGKTKVNWKHRTLRLLHLVLAIENTPAFSPCSAQLATEHKRSTLYRDVLLTTVPLGIVSVTPTPVEPVKHRTVS